MKRAKMATSDLREGMVVASDIYSKDGTLLITSRSSLSANHIIKINVYNVETVSVFVDDLYRGDVVEDPYADFEREMKLLEENVGDKDQSLEHSPGFTQFKQQYDINLGLLQERLTEIVYTDKIDLGPMYDLVNEVVAMTDKKSDLFKYVCRMRSTDDVTYIHSMNVGIMASILGRWLNYSVHTISELAVAGFLHDIGKIKLNQDILNKAGGLTEDEFAHIKQHTTLGYKMVAHTNLPIGIKHAILMHHEKLNGLGYPLGLSLDRIHDYARIISIVDIYDAMTSDRPYHTRYHPFHVIRMFEEECYGILDNRFLDVFLERIAHNFIDDRVELTDMTQAKILFIHHRNPSRPIVQTKSGAIIDLQAEDKVDIRRFI